MTVLFLVSACEPLPASSFEDIQFEPGAVLDHHVRVPFRIDPGSHDPILVELEVRLPDGQPLYEGTANVAMLRAPAFKVPSGTSELLVTVRLADGATHESRVPVVDGEALLVLP